MAKILNAAIERIVMVRMNPGEDILEALQEATAEAGIRNGMIVNGLGSSQSHHYHVVASNDLPPAEAFPKADQPRDIISLSGLIVDGRVHAHICFADDEKAEGGHLEPGTRALTFAIVALAEFAYAGADGVPVDFTDWDAIKAL